MKNITFLNWMLVVLMAFQFTSCDNEPLEGEFPQDDTSNNAGIGELVASVEGQEFVSDTASGILSNNVLVIRGLKSTGGESIVLSIENPQVGSYNLIAGPGTSTFGVYTDSNLPDSPYITYASLDGSGQLTISEMDTVALTVTGTFSFIAGRYKLDNEGNQIIDSNGNPVVETIEVRDGGFNTISYTVESNSSNPQDQFFAKVDSIEFIDETITISQYIVAGIPMLKLEAVDASGAIIRIDIPENLGVGTFNMESISNGAALIGMYNPGIGGEYLTSNPGTITFTEFGTITGQIVATFSFTATDPIGGDPSIVEITEGSFSIDYVENTTPVSDMLTAEVDGLPYVADVIEVVQTTVNSIPTVWITTEDTMISQFMRLTFPESIAVGSYEMTSDLMVGDEKIALFIPDTAAPMNFKSIAGTLTIVSYDTIDGIIEGTFEFTAGDTTGMDPTEYQITNGVFTIQID